MTKRSGRSGRRGLEQQNLSQVWLVLLDNRKYRGFNSYGLCQQMLTVKGCCRGAARALARPAMAVFRRLGSGTALAYEVAAMSGSRQLSRFLHEAAAWRGAGLTAAPSPAPAVGDAPWPRDGRPRNRDWRFGQRKAGGRRPDGAGVIGDRRQGVDRRDGPNDPPPGPWFAVASRATGRWVVLMDQAGGRRGRRGGVPGVGAPRRQGLADATRAAPWPTPLAPGVPVSGAGWLAGGRRRRGWPLRAPRWGRA